MNNFKISRPGEGEYPAYFDIYISCVEGEDILAALKNQIAQTTKLLNEIPEDRGVYRYEEGKWSIKEVVGHLIDTERVMAYRALRIARGDQTPLNLDIARRRYNNSDKYLVFHHVTRENLGFQKLQFLSERISDESGFDSCPKSLRP